MNKTTAKGVLADLLEAYNECTYGDYFYEYGDVVCEAVKCILGEQPPKTNADHIRSMTDDELAKLLLDGVAEKVCPNGCDGCDGDCDGKMLNWLKQPYKEDPE